MSSHRHKPIENTKRGVGSGIPTRCRREESGIACSNGGNRITAECKCGAKGVWCPDHKWSWSQNEEI